MKSLMENLFMYDEDFASKSREVPLPAISDGREIEANTK